MNLVAIIVLAIIGYLLIAQSEQDARMNDRLRASISITGSFMFIYALVSLLFLIFEL